MATQHTEGAFATRAEAAWQRIFVVPFCFMGMGIFRVWTETLYANNQIGFPALSVPFALPVPFVDGYSFFDFVSAGVLVLLAVFARRLAPLYRHPWVIVTCVACMVGSACVNFASLLAPELAALLFWPSVVLGGVGIALILTAVLLIIGGKQMSPQRMTVAFTRLGRMIVKTWRWKS